MWSLKLWLDLVRFKAYPSIWLWGTTHLKICYLKSHLNVFYFLIDINFKMILFATFYLLCSFNNNWCMQKGCQKLFQRDRQKWSTLINSKDFWKSIYSTSSALSPCQTLCHCSSFGLRIETQTLRFEYDVWKDFLYNWFYLQGSLL